VTSKTRLSRISQQDEESECSATSVVVYDFFGVITSSIVCLFVSVSDGTTAGAISVSSPCLELSISTFVIGVIVFQQAVKRKAEVKIRINVFFIEVIKNK
jgi:hypothetical protein